MKTVMLFVLLFLNTLVFAAEMQQTSSRDMGAPFDPTRNVLLVVESAVKRLDDLNSVQKKTMEDKIDQHYIALNEKLNMFMATTKELSVAEKSRVDAIRAFDSNAAQVDRERATTQARVLAEQVESSRENLRLLVATTAEATAKQYQSAMSDISKRITDIEKIQNASLGASGGMRDFWGYVIGAVGVMIAISQYLILRNKPQGMRS